MSTTPDFDKWLDDLPLIEEDHVFLPIGQQSDELTALYNERAALLEPTPDEVPEAERPMSESYTDRRNDIDERIAALLEEQHPNAPRIRLRALSDEDVTDAAEEVDAMRDAEGRELIVSRKVVEINARLIARAAVKPAMTPEDARLLRRRINKGEWARLVDHVNALALAQAEEETLGNS